MRPSVAYGGKVWREALVLPGSGLPAWGGVVGVPHCHHVKWFYPGLSEGLWTRMWEKSAAGPVPTGQSLHVGSSRSGVPVMPGEHVLSAAFDVGIMTVGSGVHSRSASLTVGAESLKFFPCVAALVQPHLPWQHPLYVHPERYLEDGKPCVLAVPVPSSEGPLLTAQHSSAATSTPTHGGRPPSSQRPGGWLVGISPLEGTVDLAW